MNICLLEWNCIHFCNFSKQQACPSYPVAMYRLRNFGELCREIHIARMAEYDKANQVIK